MFARKVDRNQGEIVKALEQAGCSVESLHRVGKGVPDLLVGRAGRNLLLEVKATQRAKPNERQNEWHTAWRGYVHVVRTVEDALRAVGAI